MDYPLTISNKYKLEKRLGTGTFGEVFKCSSLDQNKPFAVKLEKTSLPNPQLLNEAKKYQYLLRGNSSTEIGIPQVHYFTKEGNFNVLVMDLLGPSLEDLIGKAPGGKFPLNVVLQITFQMLQRLQYIHKKHFLHRDLKPDNFLLGCQSTTSSGKLYLIDFGLSKPYIDRQGTHIPSRTGKQLVGTARYAAISTHMGLEYGRRDDLESLAHILIYFLKGELPWQNLPARTKEEKFQKIMEKKQQVRVEVLCEGIPQEFAQLLRYARGLEFTDEIDYDYLNGMFRGLAQRVGVNLETAIAIDDMQRKQTIVSQKKENMFQEEEQGMYSRPMNLEYSIKKSNNNINNISRINQNSQKNCMNVYNSKPYTSAFNFEAQNNHPQMQNLSNNFSILNQPTNQYNTNNQYNNNFENYINYYPTRKFI